MGKSLLPQIPGFDDPLEMLHACHGRIEAQCETLLKLAEHREMENAWAALRPALTAIAQGKEARLDELAVEKFTARYRIHIAAEDANIFPLAGKILTPAQIAGLGEKMSARRGAKPPVLG